MRPGHLRATARFWLVSFLALLLLGCQSLRPTPLVGMSKDGAITTVQSVMDRSVHGWVDFAGDRATQATPADVVNAATVSFIDTGSNQTVVTGKTDGAGSFSLALGGYPLTGGATYLLEAVKGLNSQAPGSDAARFRTVLQWDGTGWLSCTNGSVPGTIVINALTTALAIETALDATNVPAASTIGKVNVTTSPATLNAAPGPYTNHPDSEISQLASDLLSYLGVDTDPVASVPAIAPTISSFQPASAGANSLVRIVGSGFSPVPSGNTVTFNGASAQVLLATPTSLVVVVPSGATSGTLRVVTGRGSVNSGIPFTVGFSGSAGLAITGFSPTFGRTDTVVTLGGSFGTGTATPTITFNGPSNVQVAAKVSAWTATSMTVSVPIGAIPGSIAVQAGTSMATAPGSFEVLPGDISWLTNLTPASSQSITSYTLPSPRHGHSSVAYGSPPRYEYIIAGWNGSVTIGDVIMYPVNSDGSLGTMRTVGRLNTVRYHHAAAIVGNYLYVVGGYDGSAYLSSIERAMINPADGSLSEFTVIGNLPVSLHQHEAIADGTNLYILGGNNPTAPVEKNAYYRYTVDLATGNLTLVTTGTLSVGATAFTIRMFGHAIVGNFLIMVGGYLNGTNSRKSITIPIKPDGTLGDGAYGPVDLNKGYFGTQMAVIDDEAYVFSGYDGANYHSSVAHAPINPATGQIGTWVYDSPDQLFPAAYANTLLVVGKRLYTFGGWGNIGTGARVDGATSYIQTAVVNADKSLSRWSHLAGLRHAIHGILSTIIGNKAWIIGGQYFTPGGVGVVVRSTQYFTIRDDGSLGPSTPGPDLKVPRWWGATAVANGFLYVFGGGPGSPVDSIERAAINPDGTLEPFVLLPNRLTTPNYVMAYAQIGKYIYLFGGASANSNYLNTIDRCEVLPDGSLGQIQRLDIVLPGPMYGGMAAVAGNYLYLTQGFDGTAHSNTVWMARINPDGSFGQFGMAPSPGVSTYTTSFGRLGSHLYMIGGYNSGGHTSATYRALIKPDGTLNSWQLFQPGGQAILPVGLSHWNSPFLVYKNHLFLFGGYNALINNGNINNCDWIFRGSVN